MSTDVATSNQLGTLAKPSLRNLHLHPSTQSVSIEINDPHDDKAMLRKYKSPCNTDPLHAHDETRKEVIVKFLRYVQWDTVPTLAQLRSFSTRRTHTQQIKQL
jgi:hypothetical protein